MTETVLEHPKIHAAIIAIMRAIGPIAKELRNTQQNYNFRGVDQVYNAIYPHLCEFGVYSTSEIIAEKHDQFIANGKTVIHSILTIRYTYHAEDGSYVSTEVVGEGTDYGGDKASNKAMSVADKYALLQLLKIPTAMEDPDREQPKPKTNPEAAKQQPRGQRVTGEMVVAVKERWKVGNPNGRLEDWSKFVAYASERQFVVTKPGEWTHEDLTKVNRAIDGVKV